MDRKQVLHYKRGDTAPRFRARCLNDTTPVNLASAVDVQLLMRTFAGTTIVDAPMTLEDQTSLPGWVRYDWAAADLDVAGDYRAEVQVTWAGGKVQTFPADGYVTILVHKDLGN